VYDLHIFISTGLVTLSISDVLRKIGSLIGENECRSCLQLSIHFFLALKSQVHLCESRNSSSLKNPRPPLSVLKQILLSEIFIFF
jgi:hypothetical protein